MLINRNSSKQKMLKTVQAYSFMVYDTLLYLDAYPDSKEALMNYNKYKKLEARARMEYEAKYGPLTKSANDGNSWAWIKGPWPWESEEVD